MVIWQERRKVWRRKKCQEYCVILAQIVPQGNFAQPLLHPGAWSDHSADRQLGAAKEHAAHVMTVVRLLGLLLLKHPAPRRDFPPSLITTLRRHHQTQFLPPHAPRGQE